MAWTTRGASLRARSRLVQLCHVDLRKRWKRASVMCRTEGSNLKRIQQNPFEKRSTTNRAVVYPPNTGRCQF